MSAVLANICHQGLTAGESGLGLECWGFGVWHFLAFIFGFFRVFQFPPLIQSMVSANEIKVKRNEISTLVKISSLAVLLHLMAFECCG